MVHDGDFRSLKKEDDILEVGLDRALELLAQPKGRGRGAAGEPLRTVDTHLRTAADSPSTPGAMAST